MVSLLVVMVNMCDDVNDEGTSVKCRCIEDSFFCVNGEINFSDCNVARQLLFIR